MGQRYVGNRQTNLSLELFDAPNFDISHLMIFEQKIQNLASLCVIRRDNTNVFSL